MTRRSRCKAVGYGPVSSRDGTPAVTEALVKAIDATLKDPEVARKLGEIAVKPQLIAGPAFGTYLANERKVIADVVNKAGIKAE